MASILFWAGWVVAWLLTALLFAWHLPFYPFSKPGIMASEAGAVFLLVMLLRWTLVAGLVVLVSALWARRRGRAGFLRVVMPVACFVAHLVAGLLNGVIWNAWISNSQRLSAGGAWSLAAAYYAIPVVTLLILAAARLRLPRGAIADRP